MTHRRTIFSQRQNNHSSDTIATNENPKAFYFTSRPDKPAPTHFSSFTTRPNNMGKRTRENTQYWLLKTEPGEWSWDDQTSAGGGSGVAKWDGVKNKQAQKHLKSMQLGDLCFFYHSGAKARRVVGVVEVARQWYPEGGDEEEGDGGDGAVDVRAVGEMRKHVDLEELKRESQRGGAGFKTFALLRQPRLSVVPVTAEVWERICELGDGYEGDGKDGGGGDDGVAED